MENECYKNYSFIPAEYDSRGRRMCDGKTFRDVVKEFEYDFTRRIAVSMHLIFMQTPVRWHFWRNQMMRLFPDLRNGFDSGRLIRPDSGPFCQS